MTTHYHRSEDCDARLCGADALKTVVISALTISVLLFLARSLFGTWPPAIILTGSLAVMFLIMLGRSASIRRRSDLQHPGGKNRSSLFWGLMALGFCIDGLIYLGARTLLNPGQDITRTDDNLFVVFVIGPFVMLAGCYFAYGFSIAVGTWLWGSESARAWVRESGGKDIGRFSGLILDWAEKVGSKKG